MKLGLIGNNIGTSQAPNIHRLLGELFGISVSYEIFDLKSKWPKMADIPKNYKNIFNIIKKCNLYCKKYIVFLSSFL